MHHRYGRYGPNAWKRKRQRWSQQRLPTVVMPTVAIVRVRVPISTERIILIIMPDGETGTYQESTDPQPGGDQTKKIAVYPTYNALPEQQRQDQDSIPSWLRMLQRVAERRAIADSQHLRDYADNEQHITFDSRRLDRRIRDFAEQDISNELLRDDSVSGYEALFDAYERAYRDKLREKTQPFAKWITILRGQKEQQLRMLLSQDRQHVK